MLEMKPQPWIGETLAPQFGWDEIEKRIKPRRAKKRFYSPGGFCECGNQKPVGMDMCRKCQRDRRKLRCTSYPKSVREDYSRRNRILQNLGFNSYSQYQQSQLWSEIRERVFEQRGRKCCKCGEHATQVHHSRYTTKNLSGETIGWLHPVCGTCHQYAEVAIDGSKRSLAKANKLLGLSVS